jgi:hypothetical protein
MPPSEFGPGLRDAALTLSIDDSRSLSLKSLKILHWKHFQECIWDNYLDGDLTTAQRQAELLMGIQKLLPEELVIVSISYTLLNDL